MSNFQNVLDTVAETTLKSGRSLCDVSVVAVSKTFPFENILDVYKQGCCDFGESKVQEALPKIKACPSDIKWHFIGHLQTNKVQKIIGKFHLVHSVDTFKLAQAIETSNITQKILLQVNASEEKTKYGMSENELLSSFEKFLKLENIEIRGLMTMAPWTEDKETIRRCFIKTRNLRDKLASEFDIDLPELSMGMSNDYVIAIEEGATLLRIGSAIFGSRKK